jgi:DNA-damage-inducible protein D
MSNELVNYFSAEEGTVSFEEMAIANGANCWLEADLMKVLGYVTREAFKKVIIKAQQACLTLAIPIEDNFIRIEDGSYKLTRFACYLVAMNGDPSKAEVATAQAYFAALADSFQSAMEQATALDRVLIREELKDGEKSLASTASRHGVQNYAFFLNAGYRGMYNMNLTALKLTKKLKPGEQLLDKMGKTELAANLFRITQTDEKIKATGVHGQKLLEAVAERVGKQVRQTMIDISGAKPEALPLDAHIKEVKKKLIGTHEQLRKIDQQDAEDARKVREVPCNMHAVGHFRPKALGLYR